MCEDRTQNYDAEHDYYRATWNATDARSSDENSVRPSAKCVHCDKTEEKSVQISIPCERSFSLVFWQEDWLATWWGRPLLPEILGQPTCVAWLGTSWLTDKRKQTENSTGHTLAQPVKLKQKSNTNAIHRWHLNKIYFLITFIIQLINKQ